MRLSNSNLDERFYRFTISSTRNKNILETCSNEHTIFIPFPRFVVIRTREIYETMKRCLLFHLPLVVTRDKR